MNIMLFYKISAGTAPEGHGPSFIIGTLYSVPSFDSLWSSLLLQDSVRAPTLKVL